MLSYGPRHRFSFILLKHSTRLRICATIGMDQIGVLGWHTGFLLLSDISYFRGRHRRVGLLLRQDYLLYTPCDRFLDGWDGYGWIGMGNGYAHNSWVCYQCTASLVLL